MNHLCLTIPQKATIMGARGFIGSHLKQYLEKQNWECYAPSKNDTDVFKNDLGVVFYCAGLTADYAIRPFDTIEAHVSLLSRLLRSAKFDSLVYLSSTRLYDSCLSTDDGMSVSNEAAHLLLNPHQPRHLYDFSKALGENLCLHFSEGRAKVARLSCVYRDANDEDGFLPQLLRKVKHAVALNEKKIIVESSPYFSRDYVHLNDVLHALTYIATSPLSKGIYNVGSGENTRNERIFSLIKHISGIDILPTQATSHVNASLVDIGRLKKELDWKPISVLNKIPSMLA